MDNHVGARSEQHGERSAQDTKSGSPEEEGIGDGTAARGSMLQRIRSAQARPRDLRAVRGELLAACRRVRFARIARYRRPWCDGFVEGFSIAFVETALRLLGNIAEEKIRVSDTPRERVILVAVTDLESNTSYSEEVRVPKLEETFVLRNGARAVERMRNARGDFVYLVYSTDEDLRRREAMLVSLAIRSCGQRHIPRDLLLDAEVRVKRTLELHAAKNATSERAWLVEQYAALGVPREELDLYLGHSLDEAAPAELVELRKVLAMVENDRDVWRTLLSYRRRQREAPPQNGSTAQAERIRRSVEATAGRRATRTEANGGAAQC